MHPKPERRQSVKTIGKNRHLFFLMLVLLFVGLGSFGTVALANYTSVSISASIVNVRSGPGLSYDIMTQIQGGFQTNSKTIDASSQRIQSVQKTMMIVNTGSHLSFVYLRYDNDKFITNKDFHAILLHLAF